jgi:hypothetical protein
MKIKCISIRQPWAWLIINGEKRIENRTWKSRYTGPLLIHAAKGMTAEEYKYAIGRRSYELLEAGNKDTSAAIDQSHLQFGGIIGITTMTGYIEKNSPAEMKIPYWSPDHYGWKLGENPIRLPFRPYKGQLNLFDVELLPEEESLLRAAGMIPKNHC